MADFVYPLSTGVDQIGAQPTEPTPDERLAAQTAAPGWGATFDAAMTLENSVYGEATRLDSRRLHDPGRKQEGWDWKSWYDAIDPEVRRTYGHTLVDIWNQDAGDARLAQINKEIEARKTRDAAGLWGVAASMAAGMLDPLTWAIPVGGEYVAAGRTIGQGVFNAARLGTTVAAGQAVQEAALQQTSVTRSMEESMYAVGGAAVLGVALGGAVHLLTNAERHAAEKTIRSLLADPKDVAPIGETVAGVAAGDAASVGAAAAAKLTREDLSPAGRFAYWLQDVFQISPNARTNLSPSVATRRIAQQAAENAVIQNMNVEGRSLGAAAETNIRAVAQGRMASVIPEFDALYKEHRAAGGGGVFSRGSAMTKKEFGEAVSYAARRGDEAVNGDEFVTKAAKMIRERVIEPFKQDAIAAGLLPKDVSVDTAASYLHRWWNKEALMANEREVRGVFTEWFSGELRGLAKTDAKIAAELATEKEIRQFAEDASLAVYNKLTGRVFDDGVSNIPEWIVPVTQGPLKERTFSIPDHLVEKYLHNDILGITEKYARQMSAEIELTRKFGRADMRDQFAEVTADYEKMRQAVFDAKTIDEIKAVTDEHGIAKWLRDKIRNPNDPAQIEAVRQRAIKYLNAEEKADIRDLSAIRDLLRGTYRTADDNWMRIANAANAYNYMRVSGGFVLSNMPDIARPAMIHGITPYFKDGIKPLITNIEALKISVKEAQKWGIVTERWLQSRLMSIADLADPYGNGTAFERVLRNGSNFASRWNGILAWNDFNQVISSVMAQDRMIRAMLNGTDAKYLASLGIDSDMAVRIGRQLAEHHQDIDGLLIAHTSRWNDPSGYMARAYGAALKKDTNVVSVLKSVGDVPLGANSAIGKMVLQFQTFGIAAHQRVLIRGLQAGPTNFISGTVAMTTIGMMAAYLRAERGGADRKEKFLKAAQNPGYLIGEGIDLGGFLTLPFWMANVGEKAFKTNVLKDPVKAAFGDASVGESQRYASRGVMSSLMGPTASTLDGIVELTQRASRAAVGESTEKNDIALKKLAAQLPPYATFFPIREIMNTIIGH